MADGVIQVPVDGAGKKIDSSEITVGANTVERQRVVLASDTTAANLAAVSAAGRLSVDASGVAVPVTDNSGSLTVDNAGTFAVQDSQVIVDNAGFTDGTSKVFPVGLIYDEVAGTALTENDIGASRMNVNRAAVATVEDGATRGRYATVTAANALKTDGSAVTQPVSGTVTANAGTGPFPISATQTAQTIAGTETTSIIRSALVDYTGSASLSSAASATISNQAGCSVASFQVTGTYVGTLLAEVSVDNSTYIATICHPVPGGAGVSTLASAATGIWQADVGALPFFRVRMTSYTSGTAVVTIRLSNGSPIEMEQSTGQGKVLQFASFTGNTAADQTVVAASAANKIKVVSYVLVAAGAVTVFWRSGAAGTALSGNMALAANGGISAIGQASSHLVETLAINTALVLNLGSAIQVGGHISYFLEP